MGEAQRAAREVINLGLEQKGSWRGGGEVKMKHCLRRDGNSANARMIFFALNVKPTSNLNTSLYFPPSLIWIFI